MRDRVFPRAIRDIVGQAVHGVPPCWFLHAARMHPERSSCQHASALTQTEPIDRVMYNLLFRASAAALMELARDPRFVGAQIGLVGVLQTWTRDLRYHPHVHYLAPGGGLAEDG